MNFDIAKASRKLSGLDLNFQSGSLKIEMYWFRVMSLDGDWKIGRHTHSAFEFHFVAEGESIVKFDNTTFIVKKGQFYITKPGEYHEQICVEGKNYVEYSMHCSITLMNTENIEDTLIYNRINHDKEGCKVYWDNNGIISLFEKVLESAFYERLGFYSQIQHYIKLIIIASSQVLSDKKEVNYKVPLKPKKDQYRFDRITQYIRDNIKHTISTKDIANYMFLSEKQVSRIIKKETDLSTKQYINKLKLKKAKELLKNNNLSLREISETLGFSSEYYFNQFFKREEGFPPGLFRSNINV